MEREEWSREGGNVCFKAKRVGGLQRGRECMFQS